MAMYYLSHTLVGDENNNSTIEKLYLALIIVVKKRRHYPLTHEVKLIARAKPLKFI